MLLNFYKSFLISQSRGSLCSHIHHYVGRKKVRERESYVIIFGQIMCNYAYITNKDSIHILPLTSTNAAAPSLSIITAPNQSEMIGNSLQHQYKEAT